MPSFDHPSGALLFPGRDPDYPIRPASSAAGAPERPIRDGVRVLWLHAFVPWLEKEPVEPEASRGAPGRTQAPVGARGRSLNARGPGPGLVRVDHPEHQATAGPTGPSGFAEATGRPASEVGGPAEFATRDDAHSEDSFQRVLSKESSPTPSRTSRVRLRSCVRFEPQRDFGAPGQGYAVPCRCREGWSCG